MEQRPAKNPVGRCSFLYYIETYLKLRFIDDANAASKEHNLN